MTDTQLTLWFVSQSLQQNTQLVDLLSQQLDIALKQIAHLKSLIMQQANNRQQEADIVPEIDINKLRQEIHDSFKNLKDQYQQELFIQKHKEKRARYLPTMDSIQQQPENTSSVLNEIVLPVNQEKLCVSDQSNNKSEKQKATIKLSDELKYEGEICKGQFDGFGIIFRSEQELYVGSFRNGLFHGQGRLTKNNWLEPKIQMPFDNWLSYSGEFFEGSFDGVGTLVMSTKEKYLGRFKHGKIEGEGVYYKCGGIELGWWSNNRFCSYV